MIGKTFWINIVVFIMAIFLFIFNGIFNIDVELVWYGVLFVFGSYSGADGISTLITSRQLPKGEKYTISYNKMLVLVIFTWSLFFISMVLSLVYHWRNIEIDMHLETAFLSSCSISAIFAGTRKLNNGMKNLGKEK